MSLFLCLTAALTAGTDAWPNARNGAQQLGVAYSDLAGDLELKWSRKTEFGVTAAAAIVDGRVYSGTLDGNLLCLELADGADVWKFQSATDDPDFRPGFNAPPTVTEDRVYIGDEDGRFYAVDRGTGKEAWSFETGGEIVGGATVIDDGKSVLFGSHDGTLYCLNASDGSERWSTATDGPVNCSVAVADGKTFLAGCDETLRIIDVTNGEEAGATPLGSPLIASPAVTGGVLYVGTYAGEVVALDVSDPAAIKKIWAFEGPGQPVHSSAAVTDSAVVVGSRDKSVRAFDRMTGDVLWEVPTRARVDSSPAVSGSRVYVGSGDKTLYGFDLKTGDVVWTHKSRRGFVAGPTIAEGRLVIGSEGGKGEILCFGPKG